MHGNFPVVGNETGLCTFDSKNSLADFPFWITAQTPDYPVKAKP